MWLKIWSSQSGAETEKPEKPSANSLLDWTWKEIECTKRVPAHSAGTDRFACEQIEWIRCADLPAKPWVKIFIIYFTALWNCSPSCYPSIFYGWMFSHALIMRRLFQWVPNQHSYYNRRIMVPMPGMNPVRHCAPAPAATFSLLPTRHNWTWSNFSLQKKIFPPSASRKRKTFTSPSGSRRAWVNNRLVEQQCFQLNSLKFQAASSFWLLTILFLWFTKSFNSP